MHPRRMIAYLVLGTLLLTSAGGVWASQDNARTYPPSSSSQGQSPYQSSGEAAPSGNIIGYQPIPSSSLAVGARVTPPAGPQAFPTQSPGGLGTSQLPPVYLTGVSGEGFYTLGRDDVLHIEVRGQQEFTGDFIIGFDGRIQYNYLGDIPVAGMTKYEVQQVLEKLLQQYVRVPVVTVSILAYNSKVVYVIGEVYRPGKYIMRGDTIKLREAILAAGLPTRHAALSRTHVIKPDLNDPRVRKVNLKKILYKGELQEDVNLSPGEIVVVPSTVLSTVNQFLNQLLNPITSAAAAAAIGVGL